MESKIKHKAVIVAAVLYQLVGFLWYQVIFGSIWQNAAGVSKIDIQAMGASPHITALIGAFCFSYVFAIIQVKAKSNVLVGMSLIFLLWLGVTLPDSVPHYTFLSIPYLVLLLDTLHTLVAMWAAGLVILVWQNNSL